MEKENQELLENQLKNCWDAIQEVKEKVGMFYDVAENDIEEKKHEYTTERIYHFTCGRCSNWWSYASTEQNSLINTRTNWGCPHCNHQANLKKKEN